MMKYIRRTRIIDSYGTEQTSTLAFDMVTRQFVSLRRTRKQQRASRQRHKGYGVWVSTDRRGKPVLNYQIAAAEADRCDPVERANAFHWLKEFAELNGLPHAPRYLIEGRAWAEEKRQDYLAAQRPGRHGKKEYKHIR
jgi:hypothetical protein